MAKALWEQPITKKVDWAGDDSTGGAAVSGQYVQQFIKDTLNKKFGYLYYNKDNNKYFIFADQEDYNTWMINPTANANLVLANFDAPAPASIKPISISNMDVTALFGSDLEPIVFNYCITDSSDNVVAEDVIMRITATSKTTGAVVSEVVTIPYDLKTYNAKASYYKELKDKDGNYVYPTEYNGYEDATVLGSRYEYSRLNRLLTSADNYSIIITLTTASTQVSSTLAFSYQLIELKISSDFNYLTGVNQLEREFRQNVTITGAQGINKIFELYIDGKPFTQDPIELNIDKDRLTSCGDDLGIKQQINLPLELFILDKNGLPVKWHNEDGTDGDEIFSIGKHTMQMWTYITLEDGTQISSEVLYYEFVVTSEEEEQTFLLYKASMTEQHTEGETLRLSGTQYSQVEYSIGVFDSRNRNVEVTYKYDLLGEGESFTELNKISHEVKNGNEDNIKYTLREKGTIRLTISNDKSSETLNIEIESKDSGIVIAEIVSDNLFKYSAENRSNNEKGKEKYWPNTSKRYADQYNYTGELNDKATFNELNGWTSDDALTLKNGATITFPFNLFDLPVTGNQGIETTGWTFEIDFETMNVQNDDAPIMAFTDNYTSELVINATSAHLTTNNGTTIKTNFKEAERIKLAFIANPLKKVNAQYQYDPDLNNTDDNPNTLFIMVNGVLDRVVKWGSGDTKSDSFKWANPTGPNKNSFTIGNTTGEANVKIYSIRIYNRALSLDEEFMNYMNDQSGDNLVNVYQKNNILNDSGDIDVELVKKMIPTLVLSMDYVSFGSFDATKKKNNTFAEAQFFDPNDPNLNFYARQCWVSPQGTSSMSYPVKNLRLYFGKTANGKTFQVINQITQKDASGNKSLVTVTNQIPLTPEYETEYWPYSEYGAANEATVRTWADEHLPYAVNKKADGTDGTMILVNKQYSLAVHNGYHKIGANRTTEGKRTLVRNYLKLGDTAEFDYATLYSKQKAGDAIIEMPRKAVSIYMVNPPAGHQFHKEKEIAADDNAIDVIYKTHFNNCTPITIKDAFGDEHDIYSTSGVDGYLKKEDGTYTEYRTGDDEIVFNSFIELKNSDLNALSDSELDSLLENYDLFINAYTPLLRTGEELGSDSYKTYIDELRYSGVALYEWNGKKFKKNKGALNYDALYYTIGANWRQYNEPKDYHVSGWTDRWTLKADYAESSNTHNGGVGRLWGNAMSKVVVNNKNICQTDAQIFVSNTIDIRTSCDCKPIVLFYNQIQNFDGETGIPEYAPTKFAGIYNIMTDKSSTKLFGFEDITNPTGSKWSAKKTECWECLNNGSNIVKGLSTEFDEKKDGKIAGYTGVKKSKIGEDRPLWGTYESRWPDTGQERHEYNPVDNPLGNNWPDDAYGVDTKNLEGFLRWMNFCKDALNYTIGEEGSQIEGYTQELYKEVSSVAAAGLYSRYTAAKAIVDGEREGDKAAAQIEMKDTALYRKWDKDGNTVYSTFGETYQSKETQTTYVEKQKVDENGDPMFEEDGVTPIMETVEKKEDVIVTHTVQWDPLVTWYTFSWRVNMEVVNKTIRTNKIGKKVYLVDIPSFDANCRCDDENGDFIDSESTKYYVKTYVTPTGDGNYEYVDNFGEKQKVTAAAIDLDPDNEHKVSLSEGSAPVSCSGLTYMQYFSATKKDHLDLNKVAAYYIYLLRFGAVDQVVKNSMMTTEDGQHYYFINYDNDTILGVRNDGYLIYNWDMDRDTYDPSLPGYAFAGAQSVLWNNLEADEEFMALVKTIDNAMNQQGLLSAEAVLTMFNEKQVGTWCERIYNEQEKIKYLSTVKKDFTTDKYLGFMQGTRKSHRNWWVNHRWDLLDAKWSSGMYSLKQMSFIYTITSASTASPQDMMITTAASKYFFTMIRNTALSYSDWFKELKAGETGVYTIRQPNSVGDPIFFYGPQKLKILNLRPNANTISRISLAEPYTVVQGDGSSKTSDWVQDDGSLMTKLLIGFDNESVSATATDISGLDKITSLEEVDIRGMQNLNGAVPTIKNLANLHRWRAFNSNATTFIPSPGVTLYEVSLSQESTNAIELNNVTFMADPNPYESLQTHMLSGNGANNANDDVENGPNTTAFGRKFGDILPTYDSIKAYKYCKSYVVDENGIPSLVPNYSQVTVGDTVLDTWTGDYVFEYEPTKYLQRAVFNNVKGLDTYQFLIDWEKALQGFGSTKQCKVNLSGIEWVIEDDPETITVTETIDGEEVTSTIANPNYMSAVNKLIRIHKIFDYETVDSESTGEVFAGTVYLKKKDGASLTPEEYDRLREEFGEDAFKASGTLTINCAENMFINVSGGTKHENALVVGTTYNNSTYYDVVKGNTFKINASVFPVAEEQNFVYVLDYASGFGTDEKPSLEVATKGQEVYSLKNGNDTIISLTNKDGEATVYINPQFENWGIGEKYLQVRVCGYRNGNINLNDDWTSKYKNTVYFKLSKRVMPNDNQIVAFDVTTDEKEPISMNGATLKTSIGDRNVHEYSIEYNDVTPNVAVSKMFVSFDNSNERISKYSITRYDVETETDIVVAEIVPYENGEYVKIDNDTQSYKFQVRHNITEFINDPNIKIYFRLTFENGLTSGMLNLDYNVLCTYIVSTDNIEIHAMTYNEETETYTVAEEAETEINITSVGTYRYKLVTTEHNIVYDINLDSNYSEFTLADDVIVVDVHPTTTTKTSDEACIYITYTPEIETDKIIELEKEIGININIAYPDNLNLVYEDENSSKQYVDSNISHSSNPFVLNLTNNTLGDYTLKFEANTNMAYAIEPTEIEMTTHYVDNDGIIHNATTTKAFTVDTESVTFTDYQKSGDDTVGTTTFTPTIENVTLDEETAKSVKSIRLTTNSTNGISSGATIKISCKVKYDSDAAHKADQTPYFSFDGIAGSDKETVVFTFEFTRSICAATTWTDLKPIDTDGKYVLYLVDELNRFFEVGVSSTLVVDDAALTNIKNNSGVAKDGWRGVGFRFGNGSNTSGSQQNTAPIFIGFKQWIGYKYVDAASEINPTTARNSKFRYNSGLYNGYDLTETLAATASKDSLIYKVWNEYDDQMKLYIPSKLELDKIIAISASGDKTGEYAMAVNNLIVACKGMNMITIERNTNPSQTYESVTNFDDLFLDVANTFGVFDLSQNTLNMNYCTSSVYMVTDLGTIYMYVSNITRTKSPLNYSISEGSCGVADSDAESKKRVFVPFVKVK